MIIETTTDLGEDSIKHPGKYKGLMGISIFHKFFAKKRMEFYFSWGSTQFSEFVIPLMDDPDKYNCMIFNDLKEKDALTKARTVSDEIKRSYEKKLRTLGITNIKILQFRDFIEDPAYINVLDTIKEYLNEDSLFKEDLIGLMEMGIGEKIKDFLNQADTIETSPEKIKSILFMYIVEELASLIYLTQKGYPIEVDPTREFSTKKLLYEGSFPKLYKKLNLSKRGHIYAHPEGIQKSTY
jgi:tRNA-dependent cyclodipeptide synthase